MFLLIALLVACTYAAPLGEVLSTRTLVLLDSMYQKKTHGKFLRALQAEGVSLTFKLASGDESIALEEFGEYLYDQLVILAPQTASFGGRVDSRAIVEFIDSGRNVLLAGGENASKTVRELAKQNNVQFDKADRSVIDHANFVKGDLDHTLILSDPNFKPLNDDIIFGDAPAASFAYRGVGLKVLESSLLVPLVRAHATAYTGTPGQVVAPEDKSLVGQNMALVIAQQARNGARVVVTGSTDMFSDELLDMSSDSAAALKRLVGLATWTFQQRGLLRARNVQHARVEASTHGENDPYRIGERVRYEVDMEQYDGKADKWVPFVTDDLQLEFIMLDPYLRQFLQHKGNGHYELEFVLPDVYGVFTFRTVYTRAGLTPITTMTRVPVRPLRHDEYERFIVSAFPYYASSFTMVIGLFLFACVFLYNDNKMPSSKSSSGNKASGNSKASSGGSSSTSTNSNKNNNKSNNTNKNKKKDGNSKKKK